MMQTDVPGYNLNRLLSKAISIAAENHGSTMNKDGTLYLLHPLRLMMKAETLDEQIVAILHDVIEDTPYGFDDLHVDGFPQYIIDALHCLTKYKGEDYEHFIKRCAIDSLARRVKLLDLYDNIDVTRLPELTDWDLKRTDKYHKAIRFLEGL